MTTLYKQNMRARIIKFKTLLSFVTSLSLFSYCLRKISLAFAADHTIIKTHNCLLYVLRVYFHMTVLPNPQFPRGVRLLFPLLLLRVVFKFVGWCNPTNAIFTPEHDWASFEKQLGGLLLLKSGNPVCIVLFAHAGQFRTMICSHWKSDIGHI